VPETREYVEKVGNYEAEFQKKSKSDREAKNDKPKKMKNPPKGGHWITLDGQHIFIEDK
jgi:Ni/Co efflux regulator RcnB